MAEVALRNVCKNFLATEVIGDVDLDIRHGEFIVLVGPSGCGKSTLLRLIAGLEDVTSGSIAIGGTIVNDLPPKDRSIAMVFQSYALFPHMTVRDNIAFGLKIARAPRPEIDARVAEAARLLKLEQLLQRKPAQLSGGQRQRVAIGRAIVRRPEVFLFDEPLSNLDAALRVGTRAEIARLHRDLGATMIYVTHDQVEAMTLADRIAVLDAGRLQQFGRPMDLYRKPRNRFVAGFIGSPKMNFLDVEACDSTHGEVIVASENFGRLSIPAPAHAVSRGQKLVLGIRPEHVSIGGKDAGLLLCRVDIVERLGHLSFVEGRLPSGESISALVSGTTDLSLGDTIGCSFSASDCHLFLQSGEALNSNRVGYSR